MKRTLSLFFVLTSFLSSSLIAEKTLSFSCGQYEKASKPYPHKPFMEDRSIVIKNFGGDKNALFAAVYDGHGGPYAAEFCKQHLHTYLLQSSEYKKGNIEAALKESFIKTNEEFSKTKDPSNWKSGTTATVALIKNGFLFLANAGDSRAALSQEGEGMVTVAFETIDHKITNKSEKKRIVAAKGTVLTIYKIKRVISSNFIGLTCTRGIGDNYFTNTKIIIPNPDVTKIKLTENHNLLILATDGIWDVITSLDALRPLSSFKKNLVFGDCLAHILVIQAEVIQAEQNKATDDMSAIVVRFDWKEPEPDLDKTQELKKKLSRSEEKKALKNLFTHLETQSQPKPKNNKKRKLDSTKPKKQAKRVKKSNSQ